MCTILSLGPRLDMVGRLEWLPFGGTLLLHASDGIRNGFLESLRADRVRVRLRQRAGVDGSNGRATATPSFRTLIWQFRRKAKSSATLTLRWFALYSAESDFGKRDGSPAANRRTEKAKRMP
jgi:hypothetical protein